MQGDWPVVDEFLGALLQDFMICGLGVKVLIISFGKGKAIGWRTGAKTMLRAICATWPLRDPEPCRSLCVWLNSSPLSITFCVNHFSIVNVRGSQFVDGQVFTFGR